MVLAPGAVVTDEELAAFAAETLAAYKVPDGVGAAREPRCPATRRARS